MITKKVTREYTEYEKKLNEYYWKCFLSEFSKIVIFLIIFLYLDLILEYIVALFSLMVLRNNGGGLHFKHYLSCLVVSFTFLYGSIYLATLLTPSRFFLCVGTFLCALIGYCLVPITSNKRPDATPKQIKKSKHHTLFIILIFFILMCICPLNSYLYTNFWTILLHILQLSIAHLFKRR